MGIFNWINNFFERQSEKKFKSMGTESAIVMLNATFSSPIKYVEGLTKHHFSMACINCRIRWSKDDNFKLYYNVFIQE